MIGAPSALATFPASEFAFPFAFSLPFPLPLPLCGCPCPPLACDVLRSSNSANETSNGPRGFGSPISQSHLDDALTPPRTPAIATIQSPNSQLTRTMWPNSARTRAYIIVISACDAANAASAAWHTPESR